MPIKLTYCASSDIVRYVHFCQTVYDGDEHYRNSSGHLCRDMLSGRSVFCKAAWIQPVMVVDEQNVILAVSTFIQAKAMPDVLQMAYFEAAENLKEASDLIVAEARKVAKERNANRIVVGLNGHVNYGLGLLADHYNERAGFGSAYNPARYIHYFEKQASRTETLVSYLRDLKDMSFARELAILQRLERKFTFRIADFRHLKREITIYTQLNNVCFANHPLYYKRRIEEDYELFKAFRWLLNEENLLIAEVGGKPIAFMLWYPDFNELVPPGSKIGFSTWIRYKWLKQSISRVKIVEIGVHPNYQHSGVIMGLFNLCLIRFRGRFTQCESGWIFSDNKKSRAINERWGAKLYKKYKVFELSLEVKD